jgi:hypothetical protein
VLASIGEAGSESAPKAGATPNEAQIMLDLVKVVDQSNLRAAVDRDNSIFHAERPEPAENRPRVCPNEKQGALEKTVGVK